MMIGHLTFAGMAEAVISAGVVAYLQVADPAIAARHVGAARRCYRVTLRPASASLQRLWVAIAVLMLLTPLGILAAGTAWGEWSPAELGECSACCREVGRRLRLCLPDSRALEPLDSALPCLCAELRPEPRLRLSAFGNVGVGLLLIISLLARLVLERRRHTEGMS